MNEETAMIELLEAPEPVVAFRVAGTLEGAEYDRIIEAVEAALAKHERIGVLMDMADFKDFTVEAALKDIRYDLSKMTELRRFPRVAILTNKEWLRMMAKAASPLLPHVEIRAFDPGEHDSASRWAGGFEA
jgi:hypothetical protein